MSRKYVDVLMNFLDSLRRILSIDITALYYANDAFPAQVKEIYLKEASDALEEKRIAELALVEAKKGW